MLVWILTRDGWHGFPALMMLLEHEKEQIIWRDYTATAMWMIGKTLARESWQLPLFLDMIHPEQQDTRTAAQIIDDIVERLLE